MAEENTVTKTVENVDRLFPEIVVNGESHVSNNYVPPVQLGQVVPQAVEQETPQNNTPSQTAQGQDVYAVELNSTLHNLVDRDLNQEVDDIEALIPNQASSENQLADKNFVNSSIATNTANFLGTYTSLADIEAIQNPTNNDYAFLETTDSAGNTLYDRYKYNAEDDEWLFEYELNNSGFTAEQWATINSGLTQQSVENEITQTVADAMATALAGLAQAMFDNNRPVDDFYIQLPLMKDPNTLFNTDNISSTWVDVTANYDGAFFRAYKNGTSGDFYNYGDTLGTKQANQNKSHAHTGSTGGANAYLGNSANPTTTTSFTTTTTAGSFGVDDPPSGWNIHASGFVKHQSANLGGDCIYMNGNDSDGKLVLDHNHTIYQKAHSHSVTINSDGGTEARPDNYAIKIWRRTA